MNDGMFDPDRITFPRWTIARDPRCLGCLFCCSMIVHVMTDNRQIAFCCCRLVESRPLSRPEVRKANTGMG
jgi:hypothetical protein